MEAHVEITSLAHGGDGIGRIEGQVCFVPGGLPGDTLRVSVVRQGRSALWAEIAEVLDPSPHRTKPLCESHLESGESMWRHFQYPAQAEWKQRIVSEQLARLGGIECELDWAEAPDWRTGYRTRAELHGDGEHLGFHARGSNTVVDVTESPLCHERLNEALRALRDLRPKGRITVTVNPEGEETLVWTKFNQRRLKHRFPLANSAKEEGPRAFFLFDGVPIVNGTFSQSSLILNRMLVEETHRMAGKPVSVLDLYCGNGNLSAGLPAATEVVGVDHAREAVKLARQHTGREYRPGGEDKMLALIKEDQWDTIVLDPPRTGAKALAPALAKSHARRIVYVSCDPATLARDLKTITQGPWQVAEAAALDMFPYTPHVEILCRLERDSA